MTQIVMFKFPIDRDISINAAMNALYAKGCRRFRSIMLPRNGDYDRIRVIGWLT